MLTCKDFLSELSDFLDESIDAELRAKLERHMAECPNCWVIADTTRRTIQIYKGMEPHPVPEDVQSRLMAALEKKIAAKGR
ncbi:MAG TPA: zf-HC2 domain-containing protein [Candidatus Solibacter sp.]|nr:zf-HC2 domain-containing protein [Candidatus Solibacter sp.]